MIKMKNSSAASAAQAKALAANAAQSARDVVQAAGAILPSGVTVMKYTKAIATVLFLSATAAPAMALEPINQEKHINSVLLSGFIGDKIADNCPTIAARKVRALNELLKLRDYALAKGYSAQVVKAFVENKEEKARGRAQADAWLKKAGAVQGQPQTYCKVGKDEIARGSLIGKLLRDKS